METEIKCPNCGSTDFFIGVSQSWKGYVDGAAILAHHTGEHVKVVSCSKCRHDLSEFIDTVEIKFE